MKTTFLFLGMVLGAFIRPSMAATPENYDVRSAADLVAICSTTPADNISSAGAGFCQGYVVGVYRTLEEIQEARPWARMFCTPPVLPPRTQAIAAYVAWANARPEELAKVPMESIVDYLAATYPCPSANPGASRAGASSSAQ